MSTTLNDTRADDLGLSRSEAWVLHHVLVDRIDAAHEAAEQPPWWAIEVVGKLEARGASGPTANDRHTGTDALTCFEAWRVRRALREYAEDDATPDGDAAVANGIVDRIDGTFEPPPAVLKESAIHR